MRIYIITLFIFLLSYGSYAQDEINKIKITDLYGLWSYTDYHLPDQECEGVTLKPIDQIRFLQNGFYSIRQKDEQLVGNYELNELTIKLFNTKKNGKKQEGFEWLSIHSIKNQTITFKIPIECGTMYINFKRQENF